ncbi:MAG: F0F1 ATP synthase subunit A [Desulfobacteraceae bacterium]|jgi:F-type H+-transporting ATPase subunit a|nr:F0F1 ATP synthase subunit A [Desulfobacteraceae bacterium]
MTLTPDHTVYWHWGSLALNATIVFTWVVMALLTAAAVLVTRRLRDAPPLEAGQNLLESVTGGILDQIRDITPHGPEQLLPFLGTLFLFVAFSNLLAAVPGFAAPTGSLSTTAALATCVFLAVPAFGIRRCGLRRYLRNYIRPNPLMLPFNILGELSRTVALAVRLFGNMMSGSMIVAILVSIAPLFFPVIMQLFGLLTGLVQAYIFAVLAAVYIAAGAEIHEQRRAPNPTEEDS